VLRMSHRVVVMADGRVTGVLSADEANQESIMRLATHRDDAIIDFPNEKLPTGIQIDGFYEIKILVPRARYPCSGMLQRLDMETADGSVVCGPVLANQHCPCNELYACRLSINTSTVSITGSGVRSFAAARSSSD